MITARSQTFRHARYLQSSLNMNQAPYINVSIATGRKFNVLFINGASQSITMSFTIVCYLSNAAMTVNLHYEPGFDTNVCYAVHACVRIFITRA